MVDGMDHHHKWNHSAPPEVWKALVDVVGRLAEGHDDAKDPVFVLKDRVKALYEKGYGWDDIVSWSEYVGLGGAEARWLLNGRDPGAGIGVENMLELLNRWGMPGPGVLSVASGTADPVAGTSRVVGVLDRLLRMSAHSVPWDLIDTAARIVARDGSRLICIPMVAGGFCLEALFAFRAAISPDGDPLTPGREDEGRALAPGGGGAGDMLGWMVWDDDPDAPDIMTAMCRPATLGYDPDSPAPDLRPYDGIRDRLASMRGIGAYDAHGFDESNRGVLMGATGLLKDMDGTDPGRDMALMGAARMLVAAGGEAERRYGDCDLILTGDALADAIVNGVGLPASFVMETAMAGSPDAARPA